MNITTECISHSIRSEWANANRYETYPYWKTVYDSLNAQWALVSTCIGGGNTRFALNEIDFLIQIAYIRLRGLKK